MAFLKVRPYLLLALVAAGAIAVLSLSGIFTNGNFGFAILNGSTDHAAHAANAGKFPTFIDQVYKEKIIDNQALYGIQSIIVHDDWVNSEISCEFCTRIEYHPGQTGVPQFAYASQNTLDYTAAKKISFYVKGENGGEMVKFKAAGKVPTSSSTASQQKVEPNQNIRYDVATKPVSLDKNWKRLEIDLSKTNLSGVVQPFAIEPNWNVNATAGGSPNNITPVVIYLKAVRYEDTQATNPLAEEGPSAP